jgi:hypothetical protein
MAFKFEFKRRDIDGNETQSGTKAVVIEIAPEIRRLLLIIKSIYIGFQSCRYREYLHIIRCFKCNGFGRIAKDCLFESHSCGHCGQDHDSKTCSKTSPKFCINCDKFNNTNKSNKRLKTDHTVFDDKCESFVRIKNIVNSRVDCG